MGYLAHENGTPPTDGGIRVKYLLRCQPCGAQGAQRPLIPALQVILLQDLEPLVPTAFKFPYSLT